MILRPPRAPYDPARTASDDVPAFVRYFSRRHAVVSHPQGPEHENVRLTALRLRGKGVKVTIDPTT